MCSDTFLDNQETIEMCNVYIEGFDLLSHMVSSEKNVTELTQKKLAWENYRENVLARNVSRKCFTCGK